MSVFALEAQYMEVYYCVDEKYHGIKNGLLSQNYLCKESTGYLDILRPCAHRGKGAIQLFIIILSNVLYISRKNGGQSLPVYHGLPSESLCWLSVHQ